ARNRAGPRALSSLAACVPGGCQLAMRRFPAASGCRAREGLMRSTPFLPGLIAGLLLVGCGGSQQPPATAPTPTAVGGPPTTAPGAGADEEEEYELDVIAEAEPDEGAPPLKVQFTASVEEARRGPFKCRRAVRDGGERTE